jgi:GNAT superfamily N-acetyltransferase
MSLSRNRPRSGAAGSGAPDDHERTADSVRIVAAAPTGVSADLEIRAYRSDDRDRVRDLHERAILDALEDAARDRGFDRLVLDTADRQDSAPFYRSQGYRETGRRQ